ncbi:hypothetical protein LZ31DRAFT_557467 [Colletotrichum somersetense]|nr:hypothetical protein LZ31DRAFT_557467 [Colletotrichum somersetense]
MMAFGAGIGNLAPGPTTAGSLTKPATAWAVTSRRSRFLAISCFACHLWSLGEDISQNQNPSLRKPASKLELGCWRED